MTSVTFREGVSDRVKNDVYWGMSAECKLQNLGGEVVAVITVTATKGYPSVEYTLLKSPSGEVLLFAENQDELTEYANPKDASRFYSLAREEWLQHHPNEPFPLLQTCRPLWRKWLQSFVQTV